MRRGEAKRSEGGRSGGRYRPPRTGRDGAELGSPQRRHSCAARDEPAVSLRGPAGAMAPRGSLHPARPCRLLSRGGRCPHGFPARIPPGLQAVGVRRAGRPSPTTGLPGGGGGRGPAPAPPPSVQPRAAGSAPAPFLLLPFPGGAGGDMEPLCFLRCLPLFLPSACSIIAVRPPVPDSSFPYRSDNFDPRQAVSEVRTTVHPLVPSLVFKISRSRGKISL